LRYAFGDGLSHGQDASCFHIKALALE
jgi:hypothetical protein